jgi:aromatic amino acid aminotransferase I
LQLYALACKHDLIILEDDPYYFLYYGIDPVPADDSVPYQRPHIPSLLSLDTQGQPSSHPVISRRYHLPDDHE